MKALVKTFGSLLKKMRGKAQRAARPAQTRLQNSGVTEPNFTKLCQT